MQTLFYISLFIFGSLFGSFGSVLIYRLKYKEKGILKGRSHCPKCKKTLRVKDLFPIFSWLSTLGKCRYCKTKISKIYPLIELSTAIIFTLTGIYLVDFNLVLQLNLSEVSKLIFWLSINFITILYIFYDILFLEIHEGIMIFGIILAFFGIFIKSTLNIGITNSLIIALICLIILSLFYIIMLKGLKEVYDILIIFFSIFLTWITWNILPDKLNSAIFSGIIGSLGIFIFFYLQIFLSRGKALGGGDLRIGIMMGLILGINFSLIGIMVSYLVGSIAGIFIIIKNLGKKGNSIVPFGPFLGIGFFLTILYGDIIQKYIENYLIIM